MNQGEISLPPSPAPFDASKDVLYSAFRSSAICQAISDADARYLDANDSFAALFGYARSEVIGHTPLELGILQHPEEGDDIFRTLKSSGRVHNRELGMRTKQRGKIEVLISIENTSINGQLCRLTVITDITARTAAEERIRRVNQALAVITDVNQILVRTRDPKAFLDLVCKAAVEKGGFALAWIGLVREDARELEIAAVAAQHERYVPLAHILVHDTDACPIDHALRSGVHAVCPLIPSDENAAGCQKQASLLGLRSSASFPLRAHKVTRGTLTLYTDRDGYFGPEELVQLDEMAGDVSMAIELAEREAERNTAAESLRISQRRYRDLVQMSPDAIFLNRNDRIVYVNPAAVSLLGAAGPEELQGKSPYDIFHPDFHETIKQRILVLRQGQPVPLIREKVVRMDGTVRDVEVAAAPFEDPEGPTIQVILRDITGRMRAEEALRESEQSLATTLYSIGNGVITSDIAGVLSRMNRVAETLTGWTEAEAKGHAVAEVFQLRSEDGGAVGDLVKAVLTERATIEMGSHVILHAREGSSMPVSCSAAPIRSSDGVVSGVVLVFDDRAAERRLEAQFLHAQKMEAVARLAGGIAHDFNNMLAVILGYAQMLEKKLLPTDPLQAHVSSITEAARRSAGLTRQLLAFARKQVATPVSLDLNAALGSVEKMLARLIGEDITLSIHRQEGLWNIRIDPTQVDQILANFCTNARDAIRDTGRITVETANVTIDEPLAAPLAEVPPGEYVRLSFSDNGEGMDESTISRIFEPFFTTKPAGEGTGIGLATVFGIVKQNNGYINVESTLGQGTTFSVYFPRFSGDLEKNPVVADQSTQKGTETVLLVEDEKQLLQLVQSILEMNGYRVLSAHSPGDAILLCESFRERIHLLLTDVVMPGMNGREMQKRLLVMRPDMKTLFMSGYTANVVSQRGILDEGQQFLSKPFTPAELAAKVRSALDS